MAVAVKNTPETAPERSFDPLAVGSLVGAVYVLATIGVVFYAVPAFWDATVGPGLQDLLGSFVNVALKIMVMLGATVGLGYVGIRWAGPRPPHGLRAGIAVAVVGVLAILLLTCGLGSLLEASLIGSNNSALGLAVMGLIAGVLLVGGGYGYTRPNFEKRLIQIEDQGWFSLASYKRTQGQRVRRGTILGILLLAGFGINTLRMHHALGSSGWELTIPFSGGMTILLLPEPRFTVLLLLALSALWLAYRVVNFPAFADFLIATEAELNKVSWTTAKRLKQDTIVVLTAVVMLTLFLFVVDIVWSRVLSWEPIEVLQTPDTKLRQTFKKLDGDHDGYLTRQEVREAQNLTKEEAEQAQLLLSAFEGPDAERKMSFDDCKVFLDKQKEAQQEVPY